MRGALLPHIRRPLGIRMLRLKVPGRVCAKLLKWLLVSSPARKVVTLDEVTAKTPPRASDACVPTGMPDICRAST